ncbi:MAG TPA: flagellar filament capping protein FliD [Burkholderiaceae bacterium]|nr:flagellar filament capping protein FliD [Burkholderiaceae bacterium]
MTVSSLGVGSNLDAETIITKLMAAEQQPLTALQKQEAGLQTKVSSFGKLQSLFSDLQTASRNLASPLLWTQTTATSADSTSVGATSTSGAAAGSYAVNVTALAKGQTVSSAALASSSSTLSSGTLTITLGSWTGDPISGFTANVGASPVNITIGAGDTSLASIRDKINAANAGVTASIINDASGARLSLRSTATGAENGFKIAAVEDTDDGNAATGLTALAFDPTSGSSQLTLNEKAQNAAATINGIDVSSASNTLSNVADGLTLTLQKTTSSAVTVSVGSDTASVRTDVDAFVKAFNALASYLQDQTKYDADSKKAGPLQANRTAIDLKNALRNVLNQASTASATYSRLSDVGIVMKSDGTLETKSAKLDAGIVNFDELRKLFSTDGATDAASGFMLRMRKLSDSVLGTDGALDAASTSLSSQLKNLGKREDALKVRLTATEARLRAQYEALDKQMAGLTGLSNYVSAQVASWNKSSS